MSKPSTRILADSVAPNGKRLTTFECIMHRFVLAEFNTHRALGRNSESSRAKPLCATIEALDTKGPAYPVSYPAKAKGMSGGEELGVQTSVDIMHDIDELMESAIEIAMRMDKRGLHKSVTNRYLEPFMWHKVITSATEWENFFELRTATDAQPEIRAVAVAMQTAYESSTPTSLDYGEWHTPLVTSEEKAQTSTVDWRLVSAARVGRVSFRKEHLKEVSADVKRAQSFIDNGHWSPLEHVATPKDYGDCRNYRGWYQLRQEYDNQTDARFDNVEAAIRKLQNLRSKDHTIEEVIHLLSYV